MGQQEQRFQAVGEILQKVDARVSLLEREIVRLSGLLEVKVKKDTKSDEKLQILIDKWNGIKTMQSQLNPSVSAGVPIMKKCTKTNKIITNKFKEFCKDYTDDEIFLAIQKYAQSICIRPMDERDFYKHRWSMQEFFQRSRGLMNFLSQV
jgi:hypothetical protein